MTELQLPTYTPSPADFTAIKIVKKQFGETSIRPTFFDDFYADFTRQSPEIAAAFAKTDMKAQKEALRSGLSFLLMFAEGNTFASRKLDGIGKSHSRTGLAIRPQLYPLWVGSLIRTVKKHQENFDATSEAAWKRVLQVGVDRITSWY